MTLNRRFVLKGMAMSGIAGWAMGRLARGRAWAAAPTGSPAVPLHGPAPAPLRALTREGPLADVFLLGAGAAGESRPQGWVAAPGMSFLLDVGRELRRGESVRIIGLLDDASATLVVDLARNVGARLLWLGHHAVTGGTSRHVLRSTAGTAFCASDLAARLQACGAGFDVTEERHGSRAKSRHWSAAARSPALGQAQSAVWAWHVGDLLASLEAPAALAAAPVREAPARAAATTNSEDRAVSFVIDAGRSSTYG